MRVYEDEFQLFRNRFQAEQGNNSRSKVAIRILSDAKSVFDITPEQYDQIAHAIKFSTGKDNSLAHYNNILKTVLRPCSSLCAASMNDHPDIVRHLLRIGRDPNHERDRHGNTALMLAVANGHVNVVKAFLELNLDINVTNNYGETIFDVIPENATEIRNLLENRQKLLSGHQEMLGILKKDDYDTCKTMLKNYLSNGGTIGSSSLNQNRQTFLHIAAGQNAVSSVKALLDSGANPSQQDNDGKTALHIAVEKGNLAAVRALLMQSDLSLKDKSGKTVMALNPSGKDRNEIISLLQTRSQQVDLKNGLRGEERFFKKLIEARDDGWNLDAIKVLINDFIKLGGNINARNSSGDTALHIFAGFSRHDNRGAVQILIASGADCKLVNANNKTPVMVAATVVWIHGSSRNNVHAILQAKEQQALASRTAPQVEKQSLTNARSIVEYQSSSPAPNSSATSSIANDPVNRNDKERPGPKWVKAQPKIDYRSFVKEVVNRTDMNKENKIRAINAEIKKISDIKHAKPEMKKFCDAGVSALRDALAVVNKQVNQPPSSRKTGPGQ